MNINRTQDEKALLRQKFINQAKKYIGVPYSQKPHSPESKIDIHLWPEINPHEAKIKFAKKKAHEN